jgi:hypothetical protein
LKTFVLSFIGISSALGLPIEIPIIVRSLADIMGLRPNMDYPIVFEHDFLATLDLDRRYSDCKYQIVDMYEHQWWTGRKPRDLNIADVLSIHTVIPCLEHYRDQRSSPWVDLYLNARPDDAEGIPVGSSNDDAVSAGHSIAGRLNSGNINAGANSARLAEYPPNAGTCPNCINFKYLLSDALGEILKFQKFGSVMTTASQNLVEIGKRKASTFHLLLEAAVLKETAAVAGSTHLQKTQLISAVSRNATAELKRLQDLPASSYKWTWGETLSKENVLALRRTGTRPGRAPHSGYDLSLANGRHLGDYSTDAPSDLTSHGQYDEVPADVFMAPPSTDLSLPRYFSDLNREVYDPLRRPISISTALSSPPIGALPALELADNWSFGSKNSTGIGREIRDPIAPASKNDLVLNLADSWMDDEGHQNDNYPERATALQLAEDWRDSDAEISPPAFDNPASAQAAALALADAWTEGDSGNERCQELGTVQETAPESATGVALQLADNWREGEVLGDERVQVSAAASVAALHLADNWSDENSDHEGEVLEDDREEGSRDERVQVSASASVAALHLADNWSDENSDHDSGLALGTALLLADNWREVDSGDGVTDGSGNDGNGLSAMTPAFILAESWSSDSDAASLPGLPTDNISGVGQQGSTSVRTYGPEDFANLRDEMFDDSD